MALEIVRAAREDVEYITDIQFAAFSTNTLLHVQFPTPESLSALRRYWTEETLRMIDGADTEVLVARKDGIIIAFAKWLLPTTSGEVLHEETVWPESCNKAMLDEYFQKVGEQQSRIIGDAPCYRRSCFLISNSYTLEFIC
jgi:hypothetical protein